MTGNADYNQGFVDGWVAHGGDPFAAAYRLDSDDSRIIRHLLQTVVRFTHHGASFGDLKRAVSAARLTIGGG